MKSIVLANLASPENAGDQTILLGTLKLLREIYPDVQVTVATRAFSHRRFYEDLKCKAVPSFPTVEPLGLKQAIQTADLVLLAGGGYFYSYRLLSPGFTFLSHLMPVAWAQKYQKPVIFLPQSYGPFVSPLSQWLFDRAVRPARVIFYREDISGAMLRKRYSKFSFRTVFMPDLALYLQQEDLGISLPEKGQKPRRIGVTVRPWRLKIFSQAMYIQKVAKALTGLYEGYGITLRIVVQVQSAKKEEGDEWISRRLQDLLLEKIPHDKVEWAAARPYFKIEDLAALYRDCDLVVGMRLHAALLSLLVGTPALVIGYQHKAEGILKSLGLEKLYLGSFHQVDAAQIQQACARLLEEPKGMQEKIHQALGAARKHIKETFRREVAEL